MGGGGGLGDDRRRDKRSGRGGHERGDWDGRGWDRGGGRSNPRVDCDLGEVGLGLDAVKDGRIASLLARTGDAMVCIAHVVPEPVAACH